MMSNNILVVEDESITALDIKSRLQELGYNVLATIATAEEAIEFAKQLKPDLVLMDIVLQGKMDGTEAALHITDNYEIPIVFLTAYSDDDPFSRAKLSSPYGYLSKPFETRELQIAIELALFKHEKDMKIKAAEKRYRMIMDNATCGLFTHDQNGVILEINKQGERILGGTRDKILGNDFRNFMPVSEREYATVQLQKLLVEKFIGPNKGYIQLLDGKIREIEFSDACVEIGDENVLLCTFTDITEENRLRAQSLLNDKLSTLGILATGIIHEINNPLTWILTNLGYLAANVNKLNLAQDNQQLLAKMKLTIDESIDGTTKIRDIVKDLKNFARIDETILTPVNIHEVLDAAIHMVQPQLNKNTKIIKNYSPDIPMLLLISSKLHQVFLNLIINAAQAIPDNVNDPNIIRITTLIEENQICIQISDTGLGISPAIMEKIFEPFFTTKPIGIGTGLGLSICSDIINSLGGQIQVTSEVGKGTAFSIYFPVNIKVPIQNKSRPPKAKTKIHKKILIVDDDPTLLISLKQILDKDYYVTTALGGRKALKLLEQHAQFDLIITDLNMPDVDGSDLYRQVLKQHAGLEQKIIFISGGHYHQTLREFLSRINNLCLEKPFTPEELLEVVDDKV